MKIYHLRVESYATNAVKYSWWLNEIPFYCHVDKHIGLTNRRFVWL